MPPSQNNVYIGKHVGKNPDPDLEPSREDETVGYIVFDSGSYSIGAMTFEAGLTSDSIRGSNNAGASYPYTIGLTPQVVVASQAGMRGGNGGWVVLHGDQSDDGVLSLKIDENQTDEDESRSHARERVAYVAFDFEDEIELSLSDPLIAP